jgi:hypothetical protein
MTHLSVDRAEVPIGLIAQLSYYQESKSNIEHRATNGNATHPFGRSSSLAARKTICQMLMDDVHVQFAIDVVRLHTNECRCFAVVSILRQCSLWNERQRVHSV